MALFSMRKKKSSSLAAKNYSAVNMELNLASGSKKPYTVQKICNMDLHTHTPRVNIDFLFKYIILLLAA